MVSLGWIVGIGYAAPPNKEVSLQAIPGGVGEVERMAISSTGNVVAGRTGNDPFQGWMLDVNGWEFRTFGGSGTAVGGDCAVTGVAVIPVEDSGVQTEEIWMSCGDGSVRGLSWDGRLLTDVLDSSGDPIVFSAVDDTLSGIWLDDNPAYLYALHVPTGAELARVHVIDPFSVAVDGEVLGSYPTSLVDNEFVEGVIVDGRLIVAHGGENLSILDLGINGAAARGNAFTGAIGCEDLAASPFGGIYCVGSSGVAGSLGTAAEFRPFSNQWYPLALGELPDPQAIVASLERDEEGLLADGWLAITGFQVKVWEMDANGAFPTTDPYFAGPEDADNPIQDMVTDDGYLYGGGEEANLHIVTQRPWVYPGSITVAPETAVGGDVVQFAFVVNQDTNWELYLGGDRFGGGTLLDSGSALAEGRVSIELTIDDRYGEGINDLYVIATNSDAVTGHGRGELSVDNPPDPPVLRSENLAFADGALVLSFDGIPDADLDRYQVYVSEAPFAAAEWPTGGPPFDGTTRLKTPIVLESAPGAHVTHRIDPLENEVTYHVAVRAWDTAGKEGPMSRVIDGTPHETFTASELSGETGGSPCSTGPAPSGAGAAALGALLLAARRRRVAAVVALGLGASGVAAAQDATDEGPNRWWKQDTTPARANFEVRYGVIGLDDESINAVYDKNPHNLLQAEIGAQILRYGEVDVGFGFFQELANTVTADLEKSSDRTMLTWWPFYLDATLRAHVLDEQPAVPFVRYGWDYVIWSEKTDDGAGGKDTLNGGKFGTHVGLGVNLLLDLLSPARASFLEARSGINDSWLTLEYRIQNIDARKRPWSGAEAGGFDFGGNAFQVGLKLDW